MLAGEHAVLTPRGRALAVATGPRLIATAVPSPGVTVLRVQARPGAAVRELMPELQNRIPAPEWAPEDHLPLAVWDAATCAVLPRSPRVVDLRWEDDPDGWRPVGTSAALVA
ncbi:MAG: hypothetical protein FJ098_04260, partial [Deltaproteobacteria bacterium]|nr:hypothetical protein [Deltaproteobacteria bacterium]